MNPVLQAHYLTESGMDEDNLPLFSTSLSMSNMALLYCRTFPRQQFSIRITHSKTSLVLIV